GVGKTRLAEEGARRTSGGRECGLWGRCWEGEGAPAFWPWIQILRALRVDLGQIPASSVQFPEIGAVLRDLAMVLPNGARLDGEQSRFWLFDILLNLLRRSAAQEPLLLILDDLHWADPGSTLLLKFLASEVGDLPLSIVGAYRDEQL